MISSIEDVRMSETNIFVLDKTAAIYVYTQDGKLSSIIDKRGRGANEYIEITDFDVHDSTIYIMSRPQKAIYTYSPDGKHRQTFKLNDFYQGIRYLGKNTFCLASANSNDQGYNFIIYDATDNSYTHKFLPFPQNESMLFGSYKPFLSRKGETLYVTTPLSNEVTELSDNRTGDVRKLVYNTKEQLPENLSDYSFIELDDKYKNTPVVKHLSLYSKTNSAEYIGFELFGEYGLSFYLTKIFNDGKSQTMMAMNETDKSFPYFSSPYIEHDGKLISSMTASSILGIERYNSLDTFSRLGLKEDDNPVIFIHTLK